MQSRGHRRAFAGYSLFTLQQEKEREAGRASSGEKELNPEKAELASLKTTPSSPTTPPVREQPEPLLRTS